MKSIWKIPPENKKLKVSVAALEIIAVLYFVLNIVFVFCLNVSEKHWYWNYILLHLNPFTVGAYFLGVTMLLAIVAMRGFWIKVLLAVPYFVNLPLSFTAAMGMDSVTDLLIFAPHIVILILLVAAIVYTRRKENKKEIFN